MLLKLAHIAQWRREHPGEQIPDGHVFTQPWPAGPNGGRRDQVIYYQYRHERARRTLRGIDEQVAKAEKAVAGRPGPGSHRPGRRGKGGGPLPITSTRMGHLVDALEHAYRVLGFEDAAGGDEVFRQLVVARIIEPVSKIDSLRVLDRRSYRSSQNAGHPS